MDINLRYHCTAIQLILFRWNKSHSLFRFFSSMSVLLSFTLTRKSNSKYKESNHQSQSPQYNFLKWPFFLQNRSLLGQYLCQKVSIYFKAMFKRAKVNIMLEYECTVGLLYMKKIAMHLFLTTWVINMSVFSSKWVII